MSRPIADYAMLGDCHSAALVSRDGCVEWWCPARSDARSVFARILDPAAGHFSIQPAEPFEVTRAYERDTMVLRTTFTTASGTLRLSEALALEPGARGHDIGLRSPHVLIRVAEVLSGRVELAMEFAARPEYGLVVPRLQSTDDGVITVGGPDTLMLVSTLDLDLDDGTARGRATLETGERATFAIHHRAGMAQTDFALVDATDALEDTIAGWRSWMDNHVR